MDDHLFDETRQLLHALKRWTDTLHADLDLSIAMRAVLEALLREGPTTVPDLARARLVSRQHIQQQVDTMLERGLVRRRPNPAHRRSSLIALSDRGRALIQNMRAEELHAIAHLQSGTSDHAMREAAQVLAAWKNALVEDTLRRAQ